MTFLVVSGASADVLGCLHTLMTRARVRRSWALTIVLVAALGGVSSHSRVTAGAQEPSQQLAADIPPETLAQIDALIREKDLRSEIDHVPGIGLRRRKTLLTTFGSVAGVRRATREELSAVVGAKVADAVLAFFASRP